MSPTGGMAMAGAARPSRRLRRAIGVTAVLMGVGTTLACTVAPHPGSSTSPPAAAELLHVAAEAGSTCVSVVEDGKAIVEHTTNDDKPVRGFSITKSVTSLLVGVAQDEGKLSIDDPVAAFVSEWQGTPSSAVTIRDLLTNTSGRQWDSRTDYAEMALKAEDKTAFAVGLKQENDPGSVWTYNNSAIQVLEAVLESAGGAPVDEFASERLFQPLGMDDTRIERDEAGNANLFAGLWTTCDDLVRLGELILNDGVGPSGDRLVSADYIRAATGSPSTELNAAYGLLWWLNHPGRAVTPEVATTGKGGAIDGPLVPAASDDVVWALGLHSQILAVLPSQEAVAVRLGEKPPKSADLAVRPFTEHVLAVLGAADSGGP